MAARPSRRSERMERDGRVARLPHEACYGRPADFVAAIQTAASAPTGYAAA